MLRIQVDMFSGRPNPEWIITDNDVVASLAATFAGTRTALAKPRSGFLGLGFREITVSQLGDDPLGGKRIPREFALASTASEDFKTSGELARRIIQTMPFDERVRLQAHELTPLTGELRDLIIERLEFHLRLRPPISRFEWPPYNPLRTTVPDERCGDCEYEVSQFNPGFWNTPSVQPYNNCYNYARNWKTNTFAQPGRAHGAQASTMSCPAVTTAAMADGLVKRCNCLPRSEWPRRLMALVIDPGVDYHWYRHQRGGFWGHKPGQTQARNFDNSGNVITNPETCNRGGYTDFCGYFYAGKSVVIN